MKKFIKILLFGLLCICFNPQSVFAGKGNTYAFLCTGSEIESEPMQNNVNGMVEVLKKNKITDNIYTTVYRTTSQSKKKDRKMRFCVTRPWRRLLLPEHRLMQ